MIAKLSTSILIFLVVLVVNTSSEYVSYKNQKVYKLHPENEEQVELLRKLQDTKGYSFWTLFDYVKVGREVRVMVDAKEELEFISFMKNVGLDATKTVDDVQR